MEIKNMEDMQIIKLSRKYSNEVAEISADCFVNDSYFDYLSKNKQEKREKLCFSLFILVY